MLEMVQRSRSLTMGSPLVPSMPLDRSWVSRFPARSFGSVMQLRVVTLTGSCGMTPYLRSGTQVSEITAPASTGTG